MPRSTAVEQHNCSRSGPAAEVVPGRPRAIPKKRNDTPQPPEVIIENQPERYDHRRNRK